MACVFRLAEGDVSPYKRMRPQSPASGAATVQAGYVAQDASRYRMPITVYDSLFTQSPYDYQVTTQSYLS